MISLRRKCSLWVAIKIEALCFSAEGLEYVIMTRFVWDSKSYTSTLDSSNGAMIPKTFPHAFKALLSWRGRQASS